MQHYHFHIVKTESDELPLKLKWDVVEGHDRYLHLPGMTVRKVFHKACLEITISLPKACDITHVSMGTYFLVLKAHLCTCIHFFKDMVAKFCQPHHRHCTHNHLHRVSHKTFFSHLHLIFFPSPSQCTIQLDKEHCFRSPSALAPSSLLFHVNEIALSINKKPIIQRRDSFLPHTKN